MMRLAVAQLRRRPGRTAALLAGVVAATTGFTLLTATAQTSQLQTTGTVDLNYRAAYDIVVRPSGNRTPLEQDRGLVRPNFLSGQFGGITLAQQAQVSSVLGVEVAAPVAMVGYVTAWASPDIDITELVDTSTQHQVLRLQPTWHTDRGLSTLTDDTPVFAYITRNPIAWPWSGAYSTGRGDAIDADDVAAVATACGITEEQPAALEVMPDGRAIPICAIGQAGGDGFAGDARTHLTVAQLLPDGTFVVGLDESGEQRRQPNLSVFIRWSMTFLLAAIDPAQEALLVGLDRAIVSGRYLTTDDVNYDLRLGRSAPLPTIPVLATTRPHLDERLSIEVSKIGAATTVAGVPGASLQQQLTSATGSQIDTREYTAEQAYRRQADELLHAPTTRVIRSGTPSYEVGPDGALRPKPVAVDLHQTWDTRFVLGLSVPWFARDTAFRPVTPLPEVDPAATAVDGYPPPMAALAVGLFDPQQLTEFSALSTVPMETYQPATATAADPQTRSLLGGTALEPNSNPGGYLATPPQMLMTLAALPRILGQDSPAALAPISAIRVRVSEVRSMDELSQERIRRVAEEIAARTGLAVDITIGSSPAPQEVVLGSGTYGRPELRLSEGWSRKGVAVALISAADRKSLLLFGLILIVCVLFLANAVSAAVRDRRRDLAVLTCLGWPSWRIAALILSEVGLVGGAAGLFGVAATFPLAVMLGVHVSPAHAWWAIPVALAVALLAGAVPALRASRSHAASALHPAVSRARRWRGRRRTVLGLAAANLVRVSGRTIVGAAALAVGIMAVTFLSAVVWVFHNEVVGTLLGDAVSVQARSVDIVAAISTVLLGGFAVADVVYLGVRERGAEFAALRATGWSEWEMARLVTYEGALTGALGALSGAALGLVATAWLAGTVSPGLVQLAVLVAVGGAILTAATAVVPAMGIRYLPTTALLAEE